MRQRDLPFGTVAAVSWAAAVVFTVSQTFAPLRLRPDTRASVLFLIIGVAIPSLICRALAPRRAAYDTATRIGVRLGMAGTAPADAAAPAPRRNWRAYAAASAFAYGFAVVLDATAATSPPMSAAAGAAIDDLTDLAGLAVGLGACFAVICALGARLAATPEGFNLGVRGGYARHCALEVAGAAASGDGLEHPSLPPRRP